jgi:hypothetical protein
VKRKDEIDREPVVKPKADLGQLHDRIVDEMKTAGLIEDLPWEAPAEVSAEVRACLTERLGHGRPLSKLIIEDRVDHPTSYP